MIVGIDYSRPAPMRVEVCLCEIAVDRRHLQHPDWNDHGRTAYRIRFCENRNANNGKVISIPFTSKADAEMALRQLMTKFKIADCKTVEEVIDRVEAIGRSEVRRVLCEHLRW